MKKDIRKKTGIRLDLGGAYNANPGYVVLDKRRLPGVDIVHDLEVFPYPLADESCLSITASHIVEHIKPWFMIQMMDELWRITKKGGQLAISHPYALSYGYVMDPTHCNPCNEATWQYFDPRYALYEVYEPKPWIIAKGFPVWQETGEMEVLYTKILVKDAEKVKGLFK